VLGQVQVHNPKQQNKTYLVGEMEATSSHLLSIAEQEGPSSIDGGLNCENNKNSSS
jgi:hypothetical protein